MLCTDQQLEQFARILYTGYHDGDSTRWDSENAVPYSVKIGWRLAAHALLEVLDQHKLLAVDSLKEITSL